MGGGRQGGGYLQVGESGRGFQREGFYLHPVTLILSQAPLTFYPSLSPSLIPPHPSLAPSSLRLSPLSQGSAPLSSFMLSALKFGGGHFL